MARRPEGPLFDAATLCGISHRFPVVIPPPSGSFPDITHPSATRQQSSKLLPVTIRLCILLGCRQRSILSHDQTLQFKSLMLNELN